MEPAAVHRRTLRVVFAAQVLSGAGLAAGITVGALLAQQMMDSTGLSGLPSALFTAGSALTAILIGRASHEHGRRVGLAGGYAVAAVGAGGVVAAAALDWVWLLLVALVVYGAGFATNLQARYAGADLAPPQRRAFAVSIVLVATTLGAVLGPNLVGPMGDVARELGVRELAGPFMLAGVAYAVGALVLFALLRPDPLLTARRVAATRAGASTGSAAASGPVTRDGDTLMLGATTLVLTQLVMVGVMTMTPIHMHEHHHGLGATGLVISLHIGAMYLPSPVTGLLVDRIGRRPMVAAAALTMVAATAVAAASPGDSVALLALALVLLGLGWNLGLVSGTALVTDSVPLAERAKVQASVDVAVALAGTGAGLGSGVMVSATSYPALSLACGAFALTLLPVLLARRAPTPAAVDI